MFEPAVSARPSRRGRRARLVVAFAVLLGVGTYVAVQYETGGGGAPRCTVGSGNTVYEFSPEQAANAATISAVGTTKGMPERAVTIALATALQESALRNITYGDRDSLGLFQQRPSQGWGTEAQILDPVYSAGIFYDRLAEVPGYSRLPLTVAAQKVQRSGFPQAYAKHEPDATLLSAALTGRSAASLTCTVRRSTQPGDAATVRAELTRSFGMGVLGGAKGAAGPSAAGGEVVVRVPAPVGSSGPEGAAAPEGEAAGSRRGWELAQWAVAQADALRIAEVSYAGLVWSAERSAEGWRTAGPEAQPTGDAPDGKGSGGKAALEVVIRVAG
ncbi:heavy metal transporter [Streptomyces coeruleoprunus]